MNNLFLIFVLTIFLSLPASAGEQLSGSYTADVIEVIDGDTFRARIKIWLGQEIETLVRLDDIDTPEIRGNCPLEKKRAYQAKNRLMRLIGQKNVTLYDIELDKYGGRIVAQVTIEKKNIGRILVHEKLARPYDRKARQSWC